MIWAQRPAAFWCGTCRKLLVDYSELTNAHHVGKSPMIIKGITEDVLRLMDHAVAW